MTSKRRSSAAVCASLPSAAAPATPDKAGWYASPYKVFDNLYWLGTRQHSSWALRTSGGIILIDTNFSWAIEPEIVEGFGKLGLNPRDIKYVIISHAHGDHDQGAALLQSRYGAKVVMGAPDWDATLQRPANAAGGVPKRDISVGPEGLKLTLGETTVEIIQTPGHTPGRYKPPNCRSPRWQHRSLLSRPQPPAAPSLPGLTTIAWRRSTASAPRSLSTRRCS